MSTTFGVVLKGSGTMYVARLAVLHPGLVVVSSVAMEIVAPLNFTVGALSVPSASQTSTVIWTDREYVQCVPSPSSTVPAAAKSIVGATTSLTTAVMVPVSTCTSPDLWGGAVMTRRTTPPLPT